MPRRAFSYIALFLFASMPLLMAMPNVEAKNERSIPVSAVGSTISNEWIPSVTEGKECVLRQNTGSGRFPLAPAQIVVTNESGSIIALADLNGAYQKTGKEDTDLACTAELQVKVPDASFYTVYLGDERIQSIPDSEFPIEANSEHQIFIILDADE